MRLGYSATARALWLSVGRTAPLRLLDQPHCCNQLVAPLSAVASFSTSARSHPSPSASTRERDARLSPPSVAAHRRRAGMAGVYTLTADTSLIFLEHYTTRLNRSKLHCAYAEHQPTPSFTCTLSISIPPPLSPPSPSSPSSVPPSSSLLSCTSAVSTQKKQAKAAAALLLCRELVERGEFDLFAVSGQANKFAFGSRREKRLQAALHSQPSQPADLAAAGKPARAAHAASKSSPPSARTVALSKKDRARDRMVLLQGLDADARLTVSDVALRLSAALPRCPTVHPFQSPAHFHFTAYLLQFSTPAEAEKAVTVLDGREDVIEGQRLAVHLLDKPHLPMFERAYYPAPQQLTADWQRAEDEAGHEHYYHFYGYRCDLFDDGGNSPYSTVLLCPAALPATQPVVLYAPLAPSVAVDEYMSQRPTAFSLCAYAGSCRLSAEELKVAQKWWARMMHDFVKRGSGEWCQEQRRYLLLPVLRDAASAATAQQPANDAELLASFSTNQSRPAPLLTPAWELINQCLSDHPAALSHTHFDSDHRSLSSVILVTPHNGVLYLPQRLSPTLTARSPIAQPHQASTDHSIATYCSVYGGEVDPALPLIEAQHLPSFAVDLTRPLLPSSSVMDTMLPPQLCRVHPVPAPLWRQLRSVPSFMYALESQLLTLSLVAACGTFINNLSVLQAALTSQAVSSDLNATYSRLMFLGASFLKTQRLLSSLPHSLQTTRPSSSLASAPVAHVPATSPLSDNTRLYCQLYEPTRFSPAK